MKIAEFIEKCKTLLTEILGNAEAANHLAWAHRNSPETPNAIHKLCEMLTQTQAIPELAEVIRQAHELDDLIEAAEPTEDNTPAFRAMLESAEQLVDNFCKTMLLFIDENAKALRALTNTATPSFKREHEFYVYRGNSSEKVDSLGWKLHIVVNYEDLRKTYDLIAHYLVVFFPVWKVVNLEAIPTPHTHDIAFTVYLGTGNDSPFSHPAQLALIINHLSNILATNNIRAGKYRLADKQLTTPYCSIRFDRAGDDYIAASEAHHFNPLREPNPYSSLVVSEAKTHHKHQLELSNQNRDPKICGWMLFYNNLKEITGLSNTELFTKESQRMINADDPREFIDWIRTITPSDSLFTLHECLLQTYALAINPTINLTTPSQPHFIYYETLTKTQEKEKNMPVYFLERPLRRYQDLLASESASTGLTRDETILLYFKSILVSETNLDIAFKELTDVFSDVTDTQLELCCNFYLSFLQMQTQTSPSQAFILVALYMGHNISEKDKLNSALTNSISGIAQEEKTLRIKHFAGIFSASSKRSHEWESALPESSMGLVLTWLGDQGYLTHLFDRPPEIRQTPFKDKKTFDHVSSMYQYPGLSYWRMLGGKFEDEKESTEHSTHPEMKM